eukprot:CAMPEP_0119513544 /NCGR_PEP_ID=MMETSP1344-20130328/31626_2 /TAXON_ID=236787 /ORGANISM="Florenciella parvula, Strain CCMP2471" /LENGTH=136 /DNA_ID=CAMNT_0007550777 /DNA_START=198 /DNA_END=606 /DNA_ORIENTATION=-
MKTQEASYVEAGIILEVGGGGLFWYEEAALLTRLLRAAFSRAVLGLDLGLGRGPSQLGERAERGAGRRDEPGARQVRRAALFVRELELVERLARGYRPKARLRGKRGAESRRAGGLWGRQAAAAMYSAIVKETAGG